MPTCPVFAGPVAYAGSMDLPPGYNPQLSDYWYFDNDGKFVNVSL